MTLLNTGMTRDGLFLIENGEIVAPVQNFRWNESPAVSFNNITALAFTAHAQTYPNAADHDGGAVCGGRRVRHDGPHHRGAHERVARAAGDRREHDRRRAASSACTRVIKPAPDGYTLLLGTIGTHAYNQTIYKKRRYDAVNDFTPVTLFSEQPMVLEVRKDLPANTLAGIRRAAEAERREDAVRLGRAPAPPRISPARCSTPRIGVNVTHVPYRGSAPATNDLIGGQIDYLCGNLGAASR